MLARRVLRKLSQRRGRQQASSAVNVDRGSTLFDAYLVVDWSAKKAPTLKEPSPDAVWVGERVLADDYVLPCKPEEYFRTRLA